MTQQITFPEGFLWGSATSAYQIEGSPLADGAGPSIWQRFVHTPGMIHDGETGDVACDHYRRYVDDIALMRRLGMRAYRFSTSWSRVLPQGRGAVNRAGLAFYDRLVDTLLENGIEPMVTLYHWDLPAALDDLGGWINSDIPKWFADYAMHLFRKLDDRVRLWTTLNEPWVVSEAAICGAQWRQGTATASRPRSSPINCCARTARQCRPIAARVNIASASSST